MGTRGLWLVASLALTACGRLHFDALTDAGGDGDVASDGGLAQSDYIKASNTNAGDTFGNSVALSADGTTMAIGARAEASAATGIDGNQADNSAASAGAVYVFVRTGGLWSQQAYVKAFNAEAGDDFGESVALSADGSTLVVGAPLEDSGGIGTPADNSVSAAGAAYVYVRAGATWSQEAYVKAAFPGLSDSFGCSVALSGDGSTLAIGAKLEASNATGIDGDQTVNGAVDSGAVYVFNRAGTVWAQSTYIKASNTDAEDVFGSSVALSNDGATLAVSAPGESSSATGVGGNQFDNSALNSGAAYVFTRSGAVWTQQAYIKASNPETNDAFGAVSLSGDAALLAVGAWTEDSAATGIDGNQADNAATAAGAAYVFARAAGWAQQAYVKASNAGSNDVFGGSVSLSGDGTSLVIGASGESSRAMGIDGDQTDDSAGSAGAVYRFSRTLTTWSQQTYIKASNTNASDLFGQVAQSADAGTIAIGALREASAATGIDGDQADNSASFSGAVYVFR